MKEMSLNDLPNELILHISTYLSKSTTSAFLRTQKTLATLLTPTLYDPYIKNHISTLPVYDQLDKSTGFRIPAPVSCFTCAHHWTSPVILAYLRGLPLSTFKAHAQPPRTFENFRNSFNTLLYRFAEHGNAGLLSIFIAKGVDIDARGGSHATPLMIAVKRKNEGMGIALLEAGADPTATNPSLPGRSILQAAILSKSLPLVKRVIRALQEREDDIFAPSTGGQLLHTAIWTGSEEMVRLLLDLGADMHEFRKTTSLIAAIRQGTPETVKLLLDRGADVLRCDADAESALFAIAKHGCDGPTMRRIMAATVEEGGDVSQCRGERKYTPLHILARRGCAKGVQLLLEHGADVRTLASHCATALHVAMIEEGGGSKAAVCQLLIAAMKSADMNLASKTTGKLRDRWGNVRVTTGTTVLHLAAMRGMLEVVSALVDAGADVLAVDGLGRTPLVVAMVSERKYRHEQICEVLMRRMSEVGYDFSRRAKEEAAAYKTLLALASAYKMKPLAAAFAEIIAEQTSRIDNPGKGELGG